MRDQTSVSRNLQMRLEETTLEKEAVERQLRLEIDSLRHKVLSLQTTNAQMGSGTKVDAEFFQVYKIIIIIIF